MNTDLPHPPARLPLRSALLASLLLLGLAGRAAAQECEPTAQSAPVGSDTTPEPNPPPGSQDSTNSAVPLPPECGPEDQVPPTASITPGTSSHTTAAVTVSIAWGDDVGLHQGRGYHWIRLNGVDVTSSFTYTVGPRSATSTGSLTLRAGANTVEAEIRDLANNDNSATVVYTWTAPPGRPLPTPAPKPEMGGRVLPVYRWYNPSTRWHLYSNALTERPGGWQEEGPRFQLFVADALGTHPFQRLYRGDLGHFYTADPAEVQAAQSAGWTLEGPIGGIAPEQYVGTVALHRHRKAVNGPFYYSTDRSEGDKEGFTYDRVVGYVLPAPLSPASAIQVVSMAAVVGQRRGSIVGSHPGGRAPRLSARAQRSAGPASTR